MNKMQLGLLMAFLSWQGVAQAETLNIKPGVWEITRTSNMVGTPPIPAEVLAKMSPEQRARIEQSQQAHKNKGPTTHVDQSCITKEKLERPFDPQDDPNKHCKHTINKQTRSEQQVHFECQTESGGAHTTGDMEVHVLNPEQIKSTVKIQAGEGARGMKLNIDMTGRWLGSDCSKLSKEDRDEE